VVDSGPVVQKKPRRGGGSRLTEEKPRRSGAKCTGCQLAEGGSLGLPQRDNAAIRATRAGSLAANTRCQSVAAEQQKAGWSCAVLPTQTDRAADHCKGRVGSRESPASLGERGFQGHASRGRIPVFRSRAIRDAGIRFRLARKESPAEAGQGPSWKENQDEATATITKIAAALRLEGSVVRTRSGIRTKKHSRRRQARHSRLDLRRISRR
jgi:hypothetical protein